MMPVNILPRLLWSITIDILDRPLLPKLGKYIGILNGFSVSSHIRVVRLHFICQSHGHGHSILIPFCIGTTTRKTVVLYCLPNPPIGIELLYLHYFPINLLCFLLLCLFFPLFSSKKNDSLENLL